jgi:hypothetical protein
MEMEFSNKVKELLILGGVDKDIIKGRTGWCTKTNQNVLTGTLELAFEHRRQKLSIEVRNIAVTLERTGEPRAYPYVRCEIYGRCNGEHKWSKSRKADDITDPTEAAEKILYVIDLLKRQVDRKLGHGDKAQELGEKFGMSFDFNINTREILYRDGLEYSVIFEQGVIKKGFKINKITGRFTEEELKAILTILASNKNAIKEKLCGRSKK